MLNRLILKVTKFQLPPPKRLGTVVKNILGGHQGPPPPPCQIGLTDKAILELDSQVLSYVKLILLTVACVQAKFINKKNEFPTACEWRRKAIDHNFPLPSKGLTAGCHLRDGIVCTISFERPVNYLCDAWHVFPPKYEAWTHFNN